MKSNISKGLCGKIDKSMTMEEFDIQYIPLNNHFAKDDAIFHFETYGEELEFVKKHDNNKIWTIVDSDVNNNMYLVNGFRILNRVGYIVTENAWIEDIEILYHEDNLEN